MAVPFNYRFTRVSLLLASERPVVTCGEKIMGSSLSDYLVMLRYWR